MADIEVYIGYVSETEDNTRVVKFSGEVLGQLTASGHNNSRGRDYALYKTGDEPEKLVLHTRIWSHWRGEGNSYTLEEVTRSDLDPMGKYWQIGKHAGFGRPLSLDEALEVRRGELE